MKLGMGKKVWVKAINSSDGIKQQGVIIGVIKTHSEHYLSFMTLKDYLRLLDDCKYVVAYERLNRIYTETYASNKLEAW